MTLLVGSIFHMTRKIVSEMTYNVSMGTLNPTIPYHTVSSIFRCRHFTVVANICWVTLQAVSSYHTSFLVIVFLSVFYLVLTSICKFFAFFSVNKFGHDIDVNCQYATWTTDLIFDSDFHNKKLSPDFDVNWHNHCRLMLNHAAKRLLFFRN